MEEDIWDGDWVLWSFDPFAGVERWYNPKEDLFKTISQTDAIVRENKQMQDITAGKRWGGGQSVASIPLDVYYTELDAAVKQDDKKFLSRWLNNSEHRAFRQKEGSV